MNQSGVQRRYDSIEHQRQSQIDKFLQGCTITLTNIEHFVLVTPVNRADDTIHNIGNVRVITTGRTVPELFEFLSTADPINKFEGCHIGPATGSVDGKDPQAGNVQLVQMMVRVG